MKIRNNTARVKRIKYGIAFMFLMVSCNSESTVVTDETVQLSAGINQISVSADQFEHGQMSNGGFELKEFNQVIQSTGVLDVPPENKSTVSAYFGGFVKTINLLPGQFVKKGQLLFVMENPEYIQIQQNFLEAKSELRYLKADYERQKTLFEDQISSEKTFLKAETDYEMTLVRFESLKKKLDLMNINPAQISAENICSTISVNSLISGYVTGVYATMGMFLNPSDAIVTIMNTDHLHVELSIFEKDLGQIKIGQAVNFTLQNDTTQHQAIVYLINHVIDPENRTVKVHCHLADESLTDRYTPGMFVEASIVTSDKRALALPQNAVVNSEGNDYVLVALSTGDQDQSIYEKKLVQTGSRQNGYVEITNAASFDTTAVFLTNGAYNLIKE